MTAYISVEKPFHTISRYVTDENLFEALGLDQSESDELRATLGDVVKDLDFEPFGFPEQNGGRYLFRLDEALCLCDLLHDAPNQVAVR